MVHVVERVRISDVLQVCVVWALDTVHQGLITNSVYEYLVTHYADPSYLSIVAASLMVRGRPSLLYKKSNVLFADRSCIQCQLISFLRRN